MKEYAELLELPDEELRLHAIRMSRRLEECHFKLSITLVAIEERGLHRLAGCSSVVQYAIRFMDMEGRKASELLRVGRSMVKLPRLASAFEDKQVGWGKMREVTRVATAETDGYWHELAVSLSTEEIQRKVSMSPRAYRESQKPEAESVLDPLLETARSEPSVATASASVDQAAALNSPRPPVKSSEPLIKLVHYLTPEEFARYERSEGLIRQQSGRRLTRNDVLMTMCDAGAALSGPESRARCPIVMRVDGESGSGWYETSQGLKPATREQVEQALEVAAEVFVTTSDGQMIAARRPARKRKTSGREASSNEVSDCDAAPELFVGHGPANEEAGPKPWDETGATRTTAPDKTGVDGAADSEGIAAAEEMSANRVAAAERSTAATAQTAGMKPASGTANRLTVVWVEDAQDSSEPMILRSEKPPGALSLGGKRRGKLKRRTIPRKLICALMARSGGRCEVPGCRNGRPLHVHHIVPLTDGGTNTLENLRLECSACHGVTHEPDFRRKPSWSAARERRKSDARKTRIRYKLVPARADPKP